MATKSSSSRKRSSSKSASNEAKYKRAKKEVLDPADLICLLYTSDAADE